MTPEQLKVSILQYAIQGKLVEQRLEEGNAEELYKQIQEEKQKLIKEGKIKKGKALPQIEENEIYFDIPETWEWVRLNDIVYNHGQKTPDITFSYIDIGSIDNTHQKLNSEENLIDANDAPSRARKIVKFGDIIYATVRPYLHNTCIIDKEFKAEPIASTGFAVLSCHEGIYNKYLFYYLLSPAFDSYANATDNAKGVAYPAINDDKLYRAIIPLPPLEEQHRIVAKIEELLPLVDRYAASYEKLEQFNAKFPDDMKKSILQYAIQGKLVEQRPEEGSAEELYKAIQEEKQKLIKEGKIKKEKPLAEITEDETPFDIPESWKWCRLGDCTSYSQPKEKISPTEITNDMWSLDLEDIEKNTGKILAKTFASERKISGDKVIFHKGQVLYSKLRPYLKKILVAPNAGICTPELVPFNTYGIDAEYISYVLKSPHVDYVINTVTYGVKMPRVGTDTMVNLLIPLPPLEEQHRIVAKIEELLPYCDRLISE